jgi:CBS domain-containing protein
MLLIVAPATIRRMNQSIREPVRPRSTVPPTLEDLLVADAMSVGVIRCSAETRLTGVAKLMATHIVHAVFVFDPGEESDEDVQL